MKRRELTVVAGFIALGLTFLLFIAMASIDRQDILVRMQHDINRQGYSPLPGEDGLEIRAQTARMTDDGLLLEGSDEPGEEPNVVAYLLPRKDPMGLCAAPSVLVKMKSNPCEMLELTFHAHVTGPLKIHRAQMELPRGGKAYRWFRTLRFRIRNLILRGPATHPSQPSPPPGPAP